MPYLPPRLPERLEGLAAVAANLLWSWNRGARALFRAIDSPLWHITRHNPVAFLQYVDASRLEACARDPEILRVYDRVMIAFERAVASENTWMARMHPEWTSGPVAYFCAEFGLHNSVPIYSGGLGVLAGDHVKAASDLGVPLVAVGLLYSRGYFDQRVRLDGWQEDSDEQFDAATTPLLPVFGSDGAPALVTVPIDDREISVGAWRLMAGRVPVYLLDTNVDGNSAEDRALVQRLYVAGPEWRLRHEAVLGVGGVRLLRALGISPAVWHANEGHASLMLVERVRELIAAGTPFEEAVHQVRATSIFTTHTPVPAGHDVFSAALVEHVLGGLWRDLPATRDDFHELGAHPDHGSAFHMTAIAARLSGRMLGVSRRHEEITRHMWRVLWPDRPTAEVPVSHVTNGVHLATWMAHHIKRLLDRQLGAAWEDAPDAKDMRSAILALDDGKLWGAHIRIKSLLMDYIHEAAQVRWRSEWGREVAHLVGAGTMLSARAMTLGFARRFATYKRADLLFRDPDRLCRLLTNPRRPVQIVFSGKAHPADDVGKRMLQRVYAFTRESRFEGRIAFLEDYELHLAHRLVQGVDLWLNLPRPPMEACGTSGMKAALNGIPQISTIDGWWAEGAEAENGWSIPPAPPGDDPDAWDANFTYHLLEDVVVPTFYSQNHEGVPTQWVHHMKAAMIAAATRFTSARMVREYVDRFYVPAVSDASVPTGAPIR